MGNTMEYTSEALVGNTIVATKSFAAGSTDEAERETWAWVASLNHNPPVTQVVLRLGGTVAWASPIPEQDA